MLQIKGQTLVDPDTHYTCTPYGLGTGFHCLVLCVVWVLVSSVLHPVWSGYWAPQCMVWVLVSSVLHPIWSGYWAPQFFTLYGLGTRCTLYGLGTGLLSLSHCMVWVLVALIWSGYCAPQFFTLYGRGTCLFSHARCTVWVLDSPVLHPVGSGYWAPHCIDTGLLSLAPYMVWVLGSSVLMVWVLDSPVLHPVWSGYWAPQSCTLYGLGTGLLSLAPCMVTGAHTTDFSSLVVGTH